jgi:hypothetical protein
MMDNNSNKEIKQIPVGNKKLIRKVGHKKLIRKAMLA